jgi:hypothetical protein
LGSPIHFEGIQSKLKKWVKNIKWSNPNVCKPDVFVFTTRHLSNPNHAHNRFVNYIKKVANLNTISSWSCRSKRVRSPETVVDLNEWIKNNIRSDKVNI